MANNVKSADNAQNASDQGQPASGYAYNNLNQSIQEYGISNQPPSAVPPVGATGSGQPVVAYGQPGIMGQPVVAGMSGQTQQIQWMQRPNGIPGCPPGLEYLTQIDQILIHQQVELFEVFTYLETKSRYQIKNSVGQQIYFASEESDFCHRQFCGPARSFTMHITDNAEQEVIKMTREFKCCAGVNCCAVAQCCSTAIQIEAPVGQIIGYVRHQRSCLAPKYAVFDAQDQNVLMIEGPKCIVQGTSCTADVEFIIYSCDMVHEVGKISKHWGGFVKEYFTKSDNFTLSIPMDLDVKMKAVLIGAVFLIDFIFFEKNSNLH